MKDYRIKPGQVVLLRVKPDEMGDYRFLVPDSPGAHTILYYDLEQALLGLAVCVKDFPAHLAILLLAKLAPYPPSSENSSQAIVVHSAPAETLLSRVFCSYFESWRVWLTRQGAAGSVLISLGDKGMFTAKEANPPFDWQDLDARALPQEVVSFSAPPVEHPSSQVEEDDDSSDEDGSPGLDDLLAEAKEQIARVKATLSSTSGSMPTLPDLPNKLPAQSTAQQEARLLRMSMTARKTQPPGNYKIEGWRNATIDLGLDRKVICNRKPDEAVLVLFHAPSKTLSVLVVGDWIMVPTLRMHVERCISSLKTVAAQKKQTASQRIDYQIVGRNSAATLFKNLIRELPKAPDGADSGGDKSSPTTSSTTSTPTSPSTATTTTTTTTSTATTPSTTTTSTAVAKPGPVPAEWTFRSLEIGVAKGVEHCPYSDFLIEADPSGQTLLISNHAESPLLEGFSRLTLTYSPTGLSLDRSSSNEAKVRDARDFKSLVAVSRNHELVSYVVFSIDMGGDECHFHLRKDHVLLYRFHAPSNMLMIVQVAGKHLKKHLTGKSELRGWNSVLLNTFCNPDLRCGKMPMKHGLIYLEGKSKTFSAGPTAKEACANYIERFDDMYQIYRRHNYLSRNGGAPVYMAGELMAPEAHLVTGAVDDCIQFSLSHGQVTWSVSPKVKERDGTVVIPAPDHLDDDGQLLAHYGKLTEKKLIMRNISAPS
ncbi:hypothetical protein VARIO8X_70072 [Burkholderiales bacterium 8X]|nr:hypothetical protein VARIO8X_70072 [Burkholderiales bacterium 8X]